VAGMGWGPEGPYLIDGAQVVDTDRSYPLVRTVESMSLAQLQGAIADAAAAVRRGQLMPKQALAG
jgi:pyruvate/2-oxoglutarate dehydrogenase complex dihydrolipoamide acyltransferase (E2) component